MQLSLKFIIRDDPVFDDSIFNTFLICIAALITFCCVWSIDVNWIWYIFNLYINTYIYGILYFIKYIKINFFAKKDMLNMWFSVFTLQMYIVVLTTILGIAYLPSPPIPRELLIARVSPERMACLSVASCQMWDWTRHSRWKCNFRSETVLWLLTMPDDNRQRFFHDRIHTTVNVLRVMEITNTLHTLSNDIDTTLLCESLSPLHFEMEQSTS